MSPYRLNFRIVFHITLLYKNDEGRSAPIKSSALTTEQGRSGRSALIEVVLQPQLTMMAMNVSLEVVGDGDGVLGLDVRSLVTAGPWSAGPWLAGPPGAMCASWLLAAATLDSASDCSSAGPWSAGPWSAGPWSAGPWSAGRRERCGPRGCRQQT